MHLWEAVVNEHSVDEDWTEDMTKRKKKSGTLKITFYSIQITSEIPMNILLLVFLFVEWKEYVVHVPQKSITQTNWPDLFQHNACNCNFISLQGLSVLCQKGQILPNCNPIWFGSRGNNMYLTLDMGCLHHYIFHLL